VVGCFKLPNLQCTCLNFGLGYNLFIASNCTCIHLTIISYVIIFGCLNFNLFIHTYEDILYPKCLLCIYVLLEDGLCRPKHVGEIIMPKQIYMHEYLQLVGINTM